MRVRGSLAIFFLLAWLIPVSVVFGGTLIGQWSTYMGGALEYYQNQLPEPIVAFVYAADGELIGIIDPHGKSDPQAMHQVGEIVSGEVFAMPAGFRSDVLDKSLAGYLQDQGYRVRDIVSHKSKYTLLLVMPHIKPTDCPGFRDVEARFKQVIGDAARGQVDGMSRYTLAALEIDSPKQSIQCVGK